MAFVRVIVCGAAIATAVAASPAVAGTYDLEIAPVSLDVSGRDIAGFAINGSVPAPTLRFTEGEALAINVANRLAVESSIHWHGFVLPYDQDGVPGISFPGIAAGETFTYRFTAPKAGTYWYHSHSGLQEGAGMYGAIVVEPREPDPVAFDREHVVVLSDWHEDSPMQVFRNLKRSPDHYNRIQRTAGEFFRDVRADGLAATLADRFGWGAMRMMPSDIQDVQGYTYLMNGMNADANWTAPFTPGERVRLRFVNAAAMTYFDVRIPGLAMTVVQADANNVEPVEVDELRIAVAETYDVIVEPREDRAYTIFAETMARDGFARGTLAPRDGMTAEVPALRAPPRLTMADMDHGAMTDRAAGESGGVDHAAMGHGGVDHAAMGHGGVDHAAMGYGAGDHAMRDTPGDADDPFYAPGSGLMPRAVDGGRVLSYADLRAAEPLYPERPAGREIEIRLGGNMERYVWTMNGKVLSQAEPIVLRHGERVRFRFVNETMMAHPMHLHGMWKIVDTGAGQWNPLKSVLSIAPNTTVLADVEVDAPGQWAFHCHLMYHMAAGMFRKVIVEGGPGDPAQTALPSVHGGHH